MISLDRAVSSATVDFKFRRSLGHEGVVGNEEAEDAAREASSHTGKPTGLLAIVNALVRSNLSR